MFKKLSKDEFMELYNRDLNKRVAIKKKTESDLKGYFSGFYNKNICNSTRKASMS